MGEKEKGEREKEESGEKLIVYVYVANNCIYVTSIHVIVYLVSETGRGGREKRGEREKAESEKRLIILVYLTICHIIVCIYKNLYLICFAICREKKRGERRRDDIITPKIKLRAVTNSKYGYVS